MTKYDTSPTILSKEKFLSDLKKNNNNHRVKLFLNQLNALMLKNNNNSIIRTIKKRKFPDSGECTHAKKQQQKCTREKLTTLPAIYFEVMRVFSINYLN